MELKYNNMHASDNMFVGNVDIITPFLV